MLRIFATAVDRKIETCPAPPKAKRCLKAESLFTTGKNPHKSDARPAPSSRIRQSGAPKAGCWVVTLQGKEAKQTMAEGGGESGGEGGGDGRGKRNEN